MDRLFEKLNTVDFERLLKKVQDARDVMEALTDGQIIVSHEISSEIRRRLIEAIQSVIPRGPVDHVLDVCRLNDVLKGYNNIFTTNYDMYLYWGRKGDDGFNIIDFFFNDGFFDRNEIDKRGRDAMYFLHGAVFLFEEGEGVKKINKENFPTLIDAIQGKIKGEDSYPLFVSEGSPDEKLSKIKSNEYLSFCYDSLRSLSGEIDIYGHRLDKTIDGHIVDAIRQSDLKYVRYYRYGLDNMSVHEQDDLRVNLRSMLRKEIELTDSTRHGLCSLSVFEDGNDQYDDFDEFL